MCFLLAVFSLAVAEDIVELEPVSANAGNVHNCNTWNDNGAGCNASPYCYWHSISGLTSGKCVDDPCLNYNAACPTGGIGISISGVTGTITVQCTNRTSLNVNNKDCQAAGTGALCGQTTPDKSSLYTYCVYSYLKDGTCPQSICAEWNFISGNAALSKHCVAQGFGGPCTALDESDCKLTPKCWWNSSSGGRCQQDYCFHVPTPGNPCAGFTGNSFGVGTIPLGDCKDWHPYDPLSGNVLDYCIYKENTKANICYFGTTGASLAETATDYKGGAVTGTYPTYNVSGSQTPNCATTALPGCEGVGNCTTIVNLKGAFAGSYCTDGTHEAAGSIIPHVSLLVTILLGLVSLLSL